MKIKDRKKCRTANSTYKKLAVQWLNEALFFVSIFVVKARPNAKPQNDGRQSLRACLPSAPGYAGDDVRPFQGLPTSPPWTHSFREKTPSGTTTKPGAVMPHCRTTQQTDKIKNEKSYNNWGDIWNR